MPDDNFLLSPTWRRMRLRVLERDHWRCVICGVLVTGVGEAVVDHIRTRAEAPHLALTMTNLRTLCRLHDAQGHREKGRNAGGRSRDERFVKIGNDEHGMPLDEEHSWNRN